MAASIPPDHSFSRDGRHLEEWLWRLLGEDRAGRDEAGEKLDAMHSGLPSVHTDWEDLTEPPDAEAQQERFAEEVRRVAARPDFDTALFVEKLWAHQLALHEDWKRRCDAMVEQMQHQGDRFERLVTPLLEQIGRPDDEESERHERRFARVIAAYFKSALEDDGSMDESESMSPSGLSSRLIFQALDVAFLAVPELLESMLDSTLQHEAVDILARCGPAALSFAPRLWKDLEALDVEGQPSAGGYVKALGSIGRGDPESVEAMIQRLGSEKTSLRNHAIVIAGHMGSEVCGREAEIVESIWPVLGSETEDYRIVGALASVGRELPDVQAYILRRASPRAPEWVADKWAEGGRSDRVQWQRGTAILALQHLSRTKAPEALAARCLPVLIEAMDSFEEYDPDWCHQGPQQRIADTLAVFGPAAAPAAEALVSHLDAEAEEFPRTIMKALKAMGPAARAVLPALEAYRRQIDDEEEPLPELGDEPADEWEDPVGEVIQILRG